MVGCPCGSVRCEPSFPSPPTCKNAPSKHSPKYVGKIEIVSDEQGIWKAGLYCAAKTPLDFEDHFGACR